MNQQQNMQYPPWAAPPWMYGGFQPHDNNRAEVLPNEVPGRVQAAFVTLSILTHKTAPILLPKEDSLGGGHELHEGQKLTRDEQTTLADACKMLSAYFRGDVECDHWERMRLRGSEINLGPEGKVGRLPPGGKLRPCECVMKPGSNGVPKNGCGWCGGGGYTMVYGVRPPNAQQEDGE